MKNILAVILLVWASSLNASDIIPVFSTGVNDYSSTISSGQSDIHYSMVDAARHQTFAVDPQAFGAYNWTWLDPSSLSPSAKWISFDPNPNNVDSRDFYIYTTSFNLDGFNLDDVKINGQWAASGNAEIYLNGNYVTTNIASLSGPRPSPWNTLKSFSIDNSYGFQSGWNSLSFKISNPSYSMPNGLLVSMSGQAVPEPKSLVLVSTAIVAIFLYRRAK